MSICAVWRYICLILCNFCESGQCGQPLLNLWRWTRIVVLKDPSSIPPGDYQVKVIGAIELEKFDSDSLFIHVLDPRRCRIDRPIRRMRQQPNILRLQDQLITFFYILERAQYLTASH